MVQMGVSGWIWGREYGRKWQFSDFKKLLHPLLASISVSGLPEATTVLFVDAQGTTVQTVNILFEFAMKLPEIWGCNGLECFLLDSFWFPE